jgi:sulfate transport system ATP-binding protein
VRLEITTVDQLVVATMTRTEYQSLGIEAGSAVSLRVTNGAPTVDATSLPVDAALLPA